MAIRESTHIKINFLHLKDARAHTHMHARAIILDKYILDKRFIIL